MRCSASRPRGSNLLLDDASHPRRPRVSSDTRGLLVLRACLGVSWLLRVGRSLSPAQREERMTVRQPRYSKEEFARRGNAIYEQQVRPQVEEGNRGRIVAIDIETGAFE